MAGRKHLTSSPRESDGSPAQGLPPVYANDRRFTLEAGCPICESADAVSFGSTRLGDTNVRCRNCGYVYVIDTPERDEEDYGDDDAAY